MPDATKAITCPLCQGRKTIYQSVLGQHARLEFTAYEAITLLSAKQLTEIQCPQCNGTGTQTLTG
jgi:hypothetical protein